MKSPQVRPLAWTLTQFRRDICPMSRTTANSEIAAGELDTFLLNGRRMVLVTAGRAYVRRKAARGGAVPPEVSAQKSAAGRKGRRMQLDAMKETA